MEEQLERAKQAMQYATTRCSNEQVLTYCVDIDDMATWRHGVYTTRASNTAYLERYRDMLPLFPIITLLV
jgi:hypothetical protein